MMSGKEPNREIIEWLVRAIKGRGGRNFLVMMQDYTYKTSHEEGHGLLSVKLIKKFISLKVEEEQAIKFHMGVYGVFGSGTRVEEYNIATLIDAFGYTSSPLVKMLYLADEIATMREKVFDERKAVRG